MRKSASLNVTKHAVGAAPGERQPEPDDAAVHRAHAAQRDGRGPAQLLRAVWARAGAGKLLYCFAVHPQGKLRLMAVSPSNSVSGICSAWPRPSPRRAKKYFEAAREGLGV